MNQQKAKTRQAIIPNKEWLWICEAVTAVAGGRAMTWSEFEVHEGTRFEAALAPLRALLQRWRKETDIKLDFCMPLEAFLERLIKLRPDWPASGEKLYDEARRLVREEQAIAGTVNAAISRIQNAVRSGSVKLFGYRKGSKRRQAITSDMFEGDFEWEWQFQSGELWPPVFLEDKARFGEWERVQVEAVTFRKWLKDQKTRRPAKHNVTGAENAEAEKRVRAVLEPWVQSLDRNGPFPTYDDTYAKLQTELEWSPPQKLVRRLWHEIGEANGFNHTNAFKKGPRRKTAKVVGAL
jgi:hypothetical protein